MTAIFAGQGSAGEQWEVMEIVTDDFRTWVKARYTSPTTWRWCDAQALLFDGWEEMSSRERKRAMGERDLAWVYSAVTSRLLAAGWEPISMSHAMASQVTLQFSWLYRRKVRDSRSGA